MIARIVRVTVKPGYYEQFEAATGENHRASLQEPGVVQFDVLKDEQNPGEYVLYEMYRDAEAALAHKETEHYKRWRATVAEMMAGPRQGADLRLLFPDPSEV